MSRAIAALVLAAGLGLPGLASAPNDDVQPGARAISVPARDGRARIQVPGGPEVAGYLAVVSLAARQAPPGTVHLRAIPATHAPLEPEPDAPKPTRDATPVAPPQQPLPEAAVTRPPLRRVFHLLARQGDPASRANYEARSSQLRALGERVQVYVDEMDLDAVADETLRDVVRTFDGIIWPELAPRFGPAADVDGDERLTVLFSRRVACVGPATDPVDGYTRPADFDARVAPPLGNRADLVCLHPRLTAGPHLRTVLTHEYAHAIIFTCRVLNGCGREEEAWLDEALAHLVEDELGLSRSNLDHRVRAYRAEPAAFSLVVDDYFARGLFRSHGHRGAAYLFLRWCVAERGPGALDALVRSSRSGYENLEAALGSSFDELFRDWAVAQASGPEPPRIDRLALGQSLSWRAVPTSCRYVWIPAGPDCGVEIALEADPALQPQLTLIRRSAAP